MLKGLMEVANIKIAVAEILLAEAGVDPLGYGDDCGIKSWLLFSKDLWKKFI